MANGYTGKVLFVDLSSGAITEETRDDAYYRKWIGGAGLAAATILERTTAGIDPLGPENMLAFTTGPAHGHRGLRRRPLHRRLQVAAHRRLGRFEFGGHLGARAEVRRV